MELKDYLHLYLGCEVEFARDGYIIPHPVKLDIYTLDAALKGNCTAKPILRPLSDMTEEENKEWNKLVKMETEDFLCGLKSAITQFAEGTKYLLSRHFDLFNLIENGLAIDSTTLKETIK